MLLFGEWGHPFSSADNEEDCPVCGEKLLYATNKDGRIRDLVEFNPGMNIQSLIIHNLIVMSMN